MQDATRSLGEPITPTSERAAPVQTIEDIERRAEEIKDAELDTLARLAAFIRELAVELPPESRMPLIFAKTANDLDTYVTYRWNPAWSRRDLDRMADECGADTLEEFAAQLQRFAERMR
jgi:hypothetical protein